MGSFTRGNTVRFSGGEGENDVWYRFKETLTRPEENQRMVDS